MNELSAGDQPFLHGHLAPRAEAVGNIGGGRLRTGCHGAAFSLRVKNLVNRLHVDRPQIFIHHRHADEKNRGIVKKIPA
jgi:hypothetical protein